MEITEKSATLWDVTPHSQVEVYRHFGEMYCLTLLACCLFACPNYSLTLNMEAVHSSEMSVNIYQPTQHTFQKTVLSK